MRFDDLDRSIVVALMEDARTPLARIAGDQGVATATVHHRLKRLREEGIVAGSRLILDWEQLGLPVVAVINLSVNDPGPLAATARRLEEIPEVQNCFATTGEFDLMLVVRTRSSAHLGEVIERVRHVAPGPSRTVVVLSTFFEGRVPPLPGEAETAAG